MGEEADRLFDPTDLMTEEELSIDQADSFAILRRLHQKELEDKPDWKLLNKLTHNKRDRSFINNIVPGGRFKAYDIAESLKESKKRLTPKQRQALLNVLAFYEASK